MDKIFYKVVNHHIIYMCDFLVNLDDFFIIVCTDFHKNCGFHQIENTYWNRVISVVEIYHGA